MLVTPTISGGFEVYSGEERIGFIFRKLAFYVAYDTTMKQLSCQFPSRKAAASALQNMHKKTPADV